MQVRTANSVPRSVNGVTHSRSQLQIPKNLSMVECRLLCAELEASAATTRIASALGYYRRSLLINTTASWLWLPLPTHTSIAVGYPRSGQRLR